MRSTIKELKQVITGMLREFGSPSGSLRTGGKGKQQYKIGKVEPENQELSTVQAERMFPESTEAWAEIVPETYPEFPFDDPQVIKARSAWFLIGGKLRVAFADMPQIELMQWNPETKDWYELDTNEN
jgi:hypothetical protein